MVLSTAASVSSSSVPAIEPSRSWHRALRDLPREHGYEPLEIEGRLPADLRGTLFRNGPNLFSTFGRRYGHWFDGDGAVSAVRFDGQGAHGAVRLVQGEGLLAERRAARPLYGGYGTPSPNLWRQLRGGVKNTANTSVMIWQGRLFAMLEAAKPIELSPDDLRTLGERDLEGVVVRSFSAHPHYVPARKAAYNFGVRYGRTTMVDLYELPDQGPARRLGSVALAGATMIHDFIATPNHLVFLAPPLRLRTLRMLLGLGSYSSNLRWRPEEGTEVIVVPIDNPTKVVRFTAEAFYTWHYANAFERDGQIVLDLVRYPDFASNDWLASLLTGTTRGSLNGTLHRAVLDPARGTLRTEQVWDGHCEFPRVASRALGRDYRWTYVAAHSSPQASEHGLHDRVAKIDLHSGALTQVALGEGQFPSEPVFVAREGGREEDDGYLLTLVYDGVRDRSHVAVLDARDVAAGPIARAWFDHHLPFTFHGNWMRAT